MASFPIPAIKKRGPVLNGPTAIPVTTEMLTVDASGNIATQSIPTGSLVGSTGSTDNRVLRSDGTGGVTVQASGVTIDDSGNISGVAMVSSTLAGSMSSVNPQTKIVVYGGFSGYGFGFDNNGELSTVVNSNLKSTLGTHLKLSSNGEVQFNSATNLSGSYDTKILRNATGPSAEIRAAGGLIVNNADATNFAQIQALNVRCANGIVQTRYINNSNTTWSAWEFPQNEFAATFSPGVAGLLRFEGKTSSFPALKRSGASLHARLADDSNFASMSCNHLTAIGGGTFSDRATFSNIMMVGQGGSHPSTGAYAINVYAGAPIAFSAAGGAWDVALFRNSTGPALDIWAAGGLLVRRADGSFSGSKINVQQWDSPDTTPTFIRHDYNGLTLHGCVSPVSVLTCSNQGWKSQSGTSFKFRNEGDTAGGPIECGAITQNTSASGDSFTSSVSGETKAKLITNTGSGVTRLELWSSYLGTPGLNWYAEVGSNSGYGGFVSCPGGVMESLNISPTGFQYVSSVASASYRQWRVNAGTRQKFNRGTTIEWYNADYRADTNTSDLVIGRDSANTLGIYTDDTKTTKGALSCLSVTVGDSASTVPTIRTNGNVTGFGFDSSSASTINFIHNGTVLYQATSVGLQVSDSMPLRFRTIGSTTRSEIWGTSTGTRIQNDSGVFIRNLANSADAALSCGAITASGTILPEANETRSIGSASLRYLQGHFRQLVLTSSSAIPQIQLGASGEGYIERSSSAVQIGYGFSSNLSVAATSVSCAQPFGTRAYTFATLPSAATHAGRLAQITDSSVTTNGTIAAGGGSSRALVFSNGTDWIVVVA